MMSATFFTNLIQKKEKKQKKIEVFSVSMINIKKALISQKKTDLRTILSDHYHEFLNVFDHMMTEKLSPLRKEDTDHQIELKEVIIHSYNLYLIQNAFFHSFFAAI